MKKLKILFIAVGDMYGSGKAMLCLINELLSQGYECRVIYAEELGLSESLNKIGVKHTHVPMRYSILPRLSNANEIIRYVGRILRDNIVNWNAEKSLRRYINEWQPDIVHTNVGVYRVADKVCRELKVPHVWHIREYQILDMLYKPKGGKKGFEKVLRSSNNYPICITHGLATYFHLEHHSRIIYDGINISSKHNENFNKNDKYFLYVGNITHHKGCEDLLKAYIIFCRTCDSDIQLWFAGGNENDYARYLMNIVENENLKNRIRFLGFVNNSSELMKKAKAVIVPSIFECFGLITAEAMFCKCLVVGRNTGGTKEQLDNGIKLTNQEIGLRFSSIDELAQQLKLISKDLINVSEYTDRAYFTVKQLYPPERNAIDIINYYHDIIDGKALLNKNVFEV